MKYEQLIREINNMIINNRTVRSFTTNPSAYNQLRENNDLLGKIKTVLKDADNEYERGCDDCMNLIRKIVNSEEDGGYTIEALHEIFDIKWTFSNIFSDHSFKELKAKIDAYEQKKKKKEEAEKPVIGDEVTYTVDKNIRHGILLSYDDDVDNYWVLTPKYHTPQKLPKSVFKLKKTGKHFDIQGMLDEIKTED